MPKFVALKLGEHSLMLSTNDFFFFLQNIHFFFPKKYTNFPTSCFSIHLNAEIQFIFNFVYA